MKLLAIALLSLFPAALYAQAINSLPEANVSLGEWPPYLFESDNFERGVGGDMIEICLPKAGYKPRYIKNSLKRMYNALKDGTVDVGFMSYKKERESYLFFGKSVVFKDYYKPFVRRDSSIVIRKIADFDQLRLGHRLGLQYSEEFQSYIKERENKKNLDVVDSDDLNIAKLVSKRIDIFVNTSETVRWRAKSLGKSSEIKELDYIIRSSDYVLTVSKKSPRIKNAPDFLNKTDQCIKQLHQDGTIDKLFKKYYDANN